jgi:hypothetical protein
MPLTILRHHRYIFEEKEQRLTSKEREEASRQGAKVPAKKKSVIARLQVRQFTGFGGSFFWLAR